LSIYEFLIYGPVFSDSGFVAVKFLIEGRAVSYFAIAFPNNPFIPQY